MFVVQRSPSPNPVRQNSVRPAARWGTLGLALGAGLAAALLAFVLVRSRMASGSAAPALVPVVVAAHDIPARTRLTAALLKVRSVPPTGAPDGSIASPADLAGRVVLRPVLTGKAITVPMVAASGAALGMAFALPPSQRAVTVALDPADGVDEFARPGDHVDILATDEPGLAPAETRTVLQNVALLAVGSQTSSEQDTSPTASGGASHVTVAVSPAQAQALVLAAARGKLHLALRPADDAGAVSLSALPAPARAAEEARPAPPHPARKPQPKPAVIQAPAPAPLPLPPLPVMTPLPPAHVTITVVKGSQSQTVSVVP